MSKHTSQLLTTRQVADMLSVHYYTAYKLIAGGTIPAVRTSGKAKAQYRVRVSDVQAYIDGLEGIA